MKKIAFIIIVGLLCSLETYAQLGKKMSEYHEKDGITVTQLDKSLYGLYKNNHLSEETAAVLQKLDEVNILNVNTQICQPALYEKISERFYNLLNNPDKYRLVKSHKDGLHRQLIYTADKDGKISDLVVWNQDAGSLDIVELRGDIDLDNIALLSRALNIEGLRSLAALSTPAIDPYREAREAGQSLQGLLNGFFNNMDDDFFADMERKINRLSSMSADSAFSPFSMLGNFDFGQVEEMLKNGGNSHSVQQFYQSFGDGSNISSNSIQITEENGKTKLKIDSQNSDITYIIDGEKAPKDNVQMPEQIMNVNIIPSKEDMKKSYLFVTSRKPLGTFTSFSNGVLTFQYNNQEYKYNLDKAEEPLLVIDGRLAYEFSIDPSSILQIRPISQIEKEVGYYPNAQVIINTK